MHKLILALAATLVAGVAQAQTQNSTTNCNVFGSNVNCNTTTQTNPGVDWNAYSRQQQDMNRQSQENINRSMQNLGNAIAAQRERKRQRREAEAATAAAATAAQQLAEQLALADQHRIAAGVSLSCTMNQLSGPLKQLGVTLFENDAKAQVTHAGQTFMTDATFTRDTVSWSVGEFVTTISRLDLSLVFGTEKVKDTGACALAHRQF